jgi:hypothetical protein
MLSHPRGWPPEYISSIVEKDIIPTIIDGMSANHDTDLIEAACGAIKNLAVRDEARLAISKYEPSISTIISVFDSNVEVSASKCALYALKNLASNEENRNEIVKNEGVGKVIEFISMHTDDPELVSAALNLVLEVSKGSSNHPLPTASVVEFVMSALKQHRQISSIAIAGFLILSIFPGNDDKVKVDSTELLDLVLACIKNHSEDGDVQSEGVRALLSIVLHRPLLAPLLRSEEKWAVLSKSELKKDD